MLSSNWASLMTIHLSLLKLFPKYNNNQMSVKTCKNASCLFYNMIVFFFLFYNGISMVFGWIREHFYRIYKPQDTFYGGKEKVFFFQKDICPFLIPSKYSFKKLSLFIRNVFLLWEEMIFALIEHHSDECRLWMQFHKTHGCQVQFRSFMQNGL